MKEAKKTVPARPAPQPPKDFYLNVVLHGPFVLFVYPDYIKAITPKIEGHAYGAGTWLKEKPIAGGVHSLLISKEQKQATQMVDESAVPVISAKAIGLDEADPEGRGHCTFILPNPESIHPRHRIPVHNIFSGKLGAFLNNKVTSLAKVHVLRYAIPHLADPRLDQCPWNSEPSLDLGHTNLHVYSESPFDMGYFHAVQDFRELMRLTPGLSLGLRRTPSGSQIPEAPHPGMAAEEEHGLRPGAAGPFASHPPLVCGGPSLIVTDME